MILDITEIDYSLLKDNIILETNKLPIKRKNEKFKRCDFIAKVDQNMIINIELNRQSHTGLIVKNLSYVFQLFSSAFQKGETYDADLVVMQINLNCFTSKDKLEKPLSKYYLTEEDGKKVITKNLIIYSLNIVKCHELYYNMDSSKIPNYVRWGELLYCSDLSRIKEITKGIMTYEERNTIYNDGIKEGIGQGVEQGRKGTLIQTIIAMVEKDFSLKDISEITGKSIEEIELIAN